MTKLENLLEKKRKIEQEIADIKAGEQSIISGMAMYDKKQWPTGKTEWRIRINVPIHRYGKPENHFNVVIKSGSREKTITDLDILIKDLLELRRNLKQIQEYNND